MPGEIKVEIGCNYEDFLRGLATVKKEADLAVLEQRRKDKEASDARRAAARKEREERKAAEKEKQDAQRKENKDAAAAWRETQRQMREKEKAEKAARSAAEDQKEQGVSIAQGFMSGGLTGGISAIGQNFGGVGMLVSEAINMFIEGFKKAVEEAKQLRNLSSATDISTGELRKLQVVAEQAGLSLSQFANAVSSFNEKIGTAKIKGSELNNLLNKLGVSQKELKDSTYDYNKGLRDLAKAHAAGTDAATLAYYGNIMFGSSFEQLLPLIKQGTGELEKAGQRIYQTSELATSQLAETSNRWEKFWANFKNVGAEGFAFFDIFVNKIQESVVLATTRALALASPITAAQFFNKESTLGPEGRLLAGKAIAATMSEKDGKAFLDELTKQIKGDAGVKLTPLGMQTAQAASSLQQMGGGDIVSAYAFNPIEETAKNTQKIVELTQQQLDEQRRGNEKSNPPKGSIYRSK